MWKCKKCKEEIEDNFTVCWKCGTAQDGSKPTFQAVIGDEKGVVDQSQKSGKGYMSNRYEDAYRTANSIISYGSMVKVLAFIIGGLIIFIGLIVASQTNQFGQSSQVGLMGILLGIVIAIPIYISGIFISAQGQILKAVLDTAVNTSQVLTKDEMRRLCFKSGKRESSRA